MFVLNRKKKLIAINKGVIFIIILKLSIIGSEGTGLSDDVKNECSTLLYVKGPTISNKSKPSVSCLNVSSASGMNSYVFVFSTKISKCFLLLCKRCKISESFFNCYFVRAL